VIEHRGVRGDRGGVELRQVDHARSELDLSRAAGEARELVGEDDRLLVFLEERRVVARRMVEGHREHAELDGHAPRLSWAMANDRGRLPKARREELDDHLKRQLERWYANAYRDDNLFLTMARRPGLLDATWGFIKYIYGGGSSIEPELFELVRVKLAWNNRCVH
jgi:hypothetical protein